MPDYNHDLLFGVNVPPNARDHQAVVATAEMADDLGPDIIDFQDHPYQPAFLDTDHLSDALLAHLKYEEEHLLEPIGRLAIRI